jgi:hypothetical protein
MYRTKKNVGITTGLVLLCTLMIASSAYGGVIYHSTGEIVCHYVRNGATVAAGIEGAEVYATDCQGNLLQNPVNGEVYHYTTESDGTYWLTFSGDVVSFRLRIILPDGSYRTTDCYTKPYSTSVVEVSPIIVDSMVAGACEHEVCKPCKGKVTQLTLQYRGSETAYIDVYQSKVKTPNFEGFVEPGDTFTINGQDKGTLGTEISVSVAVTDLDTVTTKIHTSCSQPIGPGMVFGDFLVLEGYSKDGGLLCPQEPSDDCACAGKVTLLEFQILDPPHTIQVFQKGIPLALDYKDGDPTRFTIKGIDKDGTMGTEIVIVVDGVAINLHTSCSQPIGIGMPVGQYLVITDGYSLTGGKLCEYNAN